jgi:hypothetical protein
MTLDATELVVAGSGHIYVAPYGSTLPSVSNPAHVTIAPDTLDPDYVEIGYTTEDGVAFNDARTVESIRAWQSFYPLRRIVTERDLTMRFALEQWNADTIMFAFGGGEVTDLTTGSYSYEPPDPSTLDDRSLILDWADGNDHFRLVVARGQVTESDEITLARTSTANLGITFAPSPTSSATSTWFLLTDKDSFNPTAS